MEIKEKINVKVSDLSQTGFGIDGTLTRQEWQNECVSMLLAGKDQFNRWQTELDSRMQPPNMAGYIDSSHLNPPPFIFEINSSYGSNQSQEFSSHDLFVLDITNFTFDQELNLNGYNFLTEAWFSGVEFRKEVNFNGANFQKKAYFHATTFGGNISFNGAVFNKEVIFANSTFAVTAMAEFKGSIFRKTTSFERVEFLSDANFISAVFDRYVCFDGAIFQKLANFSSKINVERGRVKDDKKLCFNSISFSGAHFKERAIFNNRHFRGTTIFGIFDGKPARFEYAPLFYNCEFFPGTTFVDTEFVINKDDHEAAQAFNTLKLAMSQQQSTRNEHLFIQKELESERLSSTDARKYLYWLYKFVSDYGFSVRRPIYSLMAIMMFFVVLYGSVGSYSRCGSLFITDKCNINGKLVAKTIEFSILEALPALGFDKYNDTLREELFKSSSYLSYSIVSILIVLQKSLGVASLFLMGLALRNLFKMK